MDDAGQPGAQRASRTSTTRWSRRARGHLRARARPRRGVPRRATARRQRRSRPRQGAALERIAFRHPFYDRASPVYLGDYVTLEHGHRHRALRAGLRRRGLRLVPPLRHEGRRDPEAGAGRRPLRARRCRSSAACRSGRRIRRSSTSCARSARCCTPRSYTHSYMHCWRHKTPIIYRATTQWFAGMDDVPGYRRRRSRRRRCARPRCAASRRRSSIPAWGKARLHGMIAQPARLDAVAPAPVGRADAVLRRTRKPASCIRARSGCSSRSRERVEQGGIEAWQSRRRRGAARRRRRRSTTRSTTRSTSGSIRARRTTRCCAASHQRIRERVSRRPLSRRLGPAPRLVPFVAARLVHAERRAAVQGAAHARLRRRRRRPQDVEVEGQRRRAAEGRRHARRRDPAAVGRARPTTRASSRSPTRS